MGAWDSEPWDSDGAADWFADFFSDLKISMLHEAFEVEDNYDVARAASYVLQSLGHVYVWPVKYKDDLDQLLEKSIQYLTNMIHPPNDDWDYLELWDNDPDVIKSVEHQIEELKARQ